MMISKAMVQLVRASVAAHSPGNQEIRRIEGMGELYFSRQNQQEVDQQQFDYLYTLRIDDVDYYFYNRIPEGVAK